MNKLVRLCLLALALALAGPSGAPTPASAAGEMQTVVLDDAMIDRLLTSYTDLKALGEKYETANKGLSSDPNALAGFGAYMRGHAAMGEFNNVLTRHGFKGFPDWINAMSTLALTLSMAEQDKNPAAMQAEMEQALARINEAPISQEQKDAMRKMFMGSTGILGRVTPENYEMVHKRREEIRAALDKAEN